MQLTNIIALISLAAVGVVASPTNARPPPPPRPDRPDVKNTNTATNNCNGGNAFCCSPTADNDGKFKGTTCKQSTTSCQTISICCNNNNIGSGGASQECTAAKGLQQPVFWY